MTLTIHDVERHIRGRLAALIPAQTAEDFARCSELRQLLTWIESQVDKAAREE